MDWRSGQEEWGVWAGAGTEPPPLGSMRQGAAMAVVGTESPWPGCQLPAISATSHRRPGQDVRDILALPGDRIASDPLCRRCWRRGLCLPAWACRHQNLAGDQGLQGVMTDIPTCVAERRFFSEASAFSEGVERDADCLQI